MTAPPDRPCAREGCGHDESDHAEPDLGRCGWCDCEHWRPTTPTDLDDALAGTTPATETAISTATVRRCRRHEWAVIDEGGEPVVRCMWCPRVHDPIASRRGKSARRRGNDYERELAARLGGTKVGHFGGPDDVRAGMFNVQAKVRANFPGWMDDELRKLPRTGGRVPVLVVADSPGQGRKRRAIVVVSLEDWTALHGSQASDAA